METCFGVPVIGIPYNIIGVRGPSYEDMRTPSLNDRVVLWSAMFRLHGIGLAVRAALKRQCITLTSNKCIYHNLADENTTLSTLLASRFTAIPAGDTPARNMLWKAINAGTVPVLFTSCSDGFWSSAYLNFLPALHSFGPNSWAVLLNSTSAMANDTYVRDELEAISFKTYRNMFQILHSLRVRNMYFQPRVPGDATDVIVEKMVTHTVGSK
jgi:hypothetical protein